MKRERTYTESQVRDLASEFQQVAEEMVEQGRSDLRRYRDTVAREVLSAERDMECRFGEPVRFNRLRSTLRLDEHRPVPRAGLCRFERRAPLAA